MSRIMAAALALGVILVLGLEGCVKDMQRGNASYLADDGR